MAIKNRKPAKSRINQKTPFKNTCIDFNRTYECVSSSFYGQNCLEIDLATISLFASNAFKSKWYIFDTSARYRMFIIKSYDPYQNVLSLITVFVLTVLRFDLDSVQFDLEAQLEPLNKYRLFQQ